MNINDPIALLLGTWSVELNLLSVLFRTLVAVIFAAILGCERATKRHAAGLRTFMLVSLATSVAVMLDTFICVNNSFNLPLISASTMIGIAIISSNTLIFSSKNQIKGLTTSVGLWASGVIGLALGAGFYTAALIAYFSLIICLSFFPKLEFYLKNRSNHFEIHLELKNKTNLQDFVTTIRKLNLKIDDIEANPAYINSGLSVFTVAITIKSEELKKYKTHKEIIDALSTLEYVYHIEELN